MSGRDDLVESGSGGAGGRGGDLVAARRDEDRELDAAVGGNENRAYRPAASAVKRKSDFKSQRRQQKASAAAGATLARAQSQTSQSGIGRRPGGSQGRLDTASLERLSDLVEGGAHGTTLCRSAAAAAGPATPPPSRAGGRSSGGLSQKTKEAIKKREATGGDRGHDDLLSFIR